ncbi:MAG TPA: GDSL-type esterase/lipase family protein [Thermoleophilaceae bacterium]
MLHASARACRAPRMVARFVSLAAVAMLVTAAAPAVARAADYVAMGDSYSSGTGTREYYEGCERSVYAYPYLIKGSFGSSFSFVACGGAKTQDVLNNQVSALSSGTEFATISIGGNDAGFSSVITKCAQPIVSCDGDINNAQSFIQNTLPGRLDNVYNQIRSRAPNAVVGVVGYPRLFNGEDCNLGTFFSSSEMTRLNQTADLLANVTRARAQAHGFTFVDARPAFIGHAVCDNVEWLNGLSNPTSESYHPNRTGHSSGYASIVRAALLAAPDPNAPVGGNGRIAFVSTRGGNSDVWVMNNNGQFPMNLTNAPGEDVDPVWSADGTQIAFASNRDGDNEIYVMNGDGTGVTKLTNNTNDDRDPTWSPNGDYIAFKSDRTGNNEIFRMTSSGGSQTNLTNNSASDFSPDWSPDGAEVVFQRFTNGSATGNGNEVFKMNADGQGQTNLTNNAASINDGSPAWSPDGTTLAFHSNRDGDFEVFTMPAIGGSATQRTSNTASDGEPAWAPNGTQLAFQSNRDGNNNDIFTMTSSGGSQTNRSSNPATDVSPSWQADSTPPLTSITVGPNGPTNTSTPQFEFTSSELGSNLQCRLDNGSFQTCPSPFTTASLADGPHTFSARSVDPAGNVDPNPVVRTFLVDTKAPSLSVECPDSMLLNAPGSAIVTASDAGSGLPPGEDPSGSYPLDTSQPGSQSFRIDAFDLAGNQASAECDYEVLYPAPGTPDVTSGGNPNAGAFTLSWVPAAPPEYGLHYTLERRDADDDAWQQAASGIDGTDYSFTAGDSADEGTWSYRVKGSDGDHETPWSEVSASVKVDQTAPAKPAIVPDRAPDYAGDGGWYRDSVLVSTEDRGDPTLRDGSDPTGVDASTVAGPELLDASGTVHRTVSDRVGNTSDEATEDFQVDTEKPSLQLDCPEDVVLGGEASVEVTAGDSQSGLASDPSGAVEVDTSHVGTQTIERTATDNVGHERTKSCHVLVRYDYGGLLQPVNRDGSSVFKLGSTIPLKLRLSDHAGNSVAGAHVEVQLERTSTSVDGTEFEEVVDATPTIGKTFEYSDGSEVYRFNLSTKPLSAGTWRIRISLDDGTVHRTQISLR